MASGRNWRSFIRNVRRSILHRLAPSQAPSFTASRDYGATEQGYIHSSPAQESQSSRFVGEIPTSPVQPARLMNAQPEETLTNPYNTKTSHVGFSILYSYTI